MDDKPKAGGYEKYIVASVAMSCLSNLLMTRWMEDHTEADLDELAHAIEMKIKNATIEGLSYSQQEALVRRAVEFTDRFLADFRKSSRDKS